MKKIDNLFVLGGDNDKEKTTYSTFLSVSKGKNDIWKETKLKPFLFSRSCFGIVSFDNFLFILGGYDGVRTIGSVECYDFLMNEWTIYPSLLERRSSCVSLISGTKIYVIGGVSKNKIVDKIEEFDFTTGKWKILTKDLSPSSGCGAVVFNNKLYIFGGFLTEKLTSGQLFMYDLQIEQWTMFKPMNEPRSSFGYCLFHLDGRPIIVVAGGKNEKYEATQKCEYYNVENNEWIPMGDLNQKRKFCSLVSYQNKIHVVGGHDDEKCISSIESYCFETKQWTLEHCNETDILCGQGVLSLEQKTFQKIQNKTIISNNITWEGKWKKKKRNGQFFRKEKEECMEFYFLDNVILSKEDYEYHLQVQKLKVPSEFLCPISFELMTDPFMTMVGHTYERKNIEKWLITNTTDPLTNEVIESRLIPNILLKKIIQNFIETKLRKKK